MALTGRPHGYDTLGVSLQLVGLPALWAVSLDYLLPAAITLPEKCDLHVRLDTAEAARSPVWDTVRPPGSSCTP